MEFFYDESGNPYAFSYKASAAATPVTYYYLTNLQGDVTAILDANGNVVSEYTYDAWGEIISAAGGTASSPTSGNNRNNKNSNWKKVNEKYLESQLRKQGTDPHSLKYEYLGQRTKVSRYDIYVDKGTGRLAIFEQSTRRLVTITDYFIK